MQTPARRHLVVAAAAVLMGVAGAVTALVLPSADVGRVRVPEFGPPATVPFRPELVTPLPIEAALPAPVIPAPGDAGVAAASLYTPVTPPPRRASPTPDRNRSESAPQRRAESNGDRRSDADSAQQRGKGDGESAEEGGGEKDGKGAKRGGGEKKDMGEKKGGGKKGGKGSG